MMMRSLIRYDWKLLAADRTLSAVLLLLALLLGAAAWNGERFRTERAEAVERVRDEVRTADAADRAALVDTPPNPEEPWNDPGNPYRRRALAALSPGPLADMAVGVSDVQPYWSQVGLFTLSFNVFRQYEISNPLLLAVGGFDLAWAVAVLLPLLVITLSYDLVSTERERGTLALALSQGISPGRYFGARLFARLFLASLLVAAGIVLARIASGAPFGGDETLAKLALWLAAALAYLAFWFALAFFVQSLGLGSATNASILLAAWIAATLLLPAGVSRLAAERHPVPSRYALLAEERRAESETQRLQTELVERFAHDHPELLRADDVDRADWIRRSYASRIDLERQLAPAHATFREALAAQQQLIDRYRFLSPTLLVHQAFLELSGSDMARFRAFEAAVAGFAVEYRQQLVGPVFRNERLTAAGFDALPVFRLAEPDLTANLRSVLPALLALTGGAAALALLGGARLRKLG